MAGGAPLISANFDDIPSNNLILRRPRSGRLEGWAMHEIVEKAGSQHLLCCPPFETRPCGPLLRVRLVCKLAPMSGAPPALSRFRDLHLVIEVVGDEVAHDLVEVLVGLETERPRPLGVDALW